MKTSGIFSYLLFGIFICILVACGGEKQQFTIRGEIGGASGKTLYLEQVGASKIQVLDSVKLRLDAFRFQGKRPAFPDFYRLRLDRQVINLAVDSTETIIVQADALHFSKAYTVEDEFSKSQKIKELTLLQTTASLQYNALQKQYEAGELSLDQYTQGVNAAIEAYKSKARDYIMTDFLSLPAYYALFQQINNLYIFDIYDKEDNKLYGAVANAWNTFYPESPRAAQLKNIYTGSRIVLRGEQSIEIQEVDSKTLFDISLPSVDGTEIRLSEIAQGKVTLIDFTVYSVGVSPAHNLQLAELYNQYHLQGLEIYQISMDTDSHLWKNAAVNLPWICVREPEFPSPTAQKYNVRNIPVIFIWNRAGEIVARIDDYSTLKSEIVKYLKQ